MTDKIQTTPPNEGREIEGEIWDMPKMILEKAARATSMYVSGTITKETRESLYDECHQAIKDYATALCTKYAREREDKLILDIRKMLANEGVLSYSVEKAFEEIIQHTQAKVEGIREKIENPFCYDDESREHSAFSKGVQAVLTALQDEGKD